MLNSSCHCSIFHLAGLYNIGVASSYHTYLFMNFLTITVIIYKDFLEYSLNVDVSINLIKEEYNFMVLGCCRFVSFVYKVNNFLLGNPSCMLRVINVLSKTSLRYYIMAVFPIPVSPIISTGYLALILMYINASFKKLSCVNTILSVSNSVLAIRSGVF